MRKLINVLKHTDADMGIGAMIVFIAMVLVAGIAASVLIQTANKLEIQAMTTGQETTAEVATGISVDSITGQKAGAYNVSAIVPDSTSSWANNTIANATITVSPRAGSRDIDLSKTVIECTDSVSKIIMSYNSTDFFYNPDESGVFGTAAFWGTPKEFGVIVLEDADNSCTATNPVINRGDAVLLCITPAAAFPAASGNSGWNERADIWGMVIPEDGAPGIFAFRTPASYSDTVYELY